MKPFSLFLFLCCITAMVSCAKQKETKTVVALESLEKNGIKTLEDAIKGEEFTDSIEIEGDEDFIEEIKEKPLVVNDEEKVVVETLKNTEKPIKKKDATKGVVIEEEIATVPVKEIGSKNEKEGTSKKVQKIEKESTQVQHKVAKIATKEVESIGAMEFDHTLFDAFLNKYVSSTGNVNYKMMKSHQIELESYINSLQNKTLKTTWTTNQKLAYWINAYNAFTLKLILDHYPVNSITAIAGGKPWDKKWIALNGKMYSLNQIENDIIRPQFKEPRIHFAVNCAAKSCPKLGNFAYTASNLNAKLTSQTKAFINSNLNQISATHLKISKIFEWYKSDFGDLVPFIKKYSTVVINDNATVEYNEYDWSL
ncbi:DUF547 domain-containing protein, partial [Aquimarina agarilytica]|uniref:DUF547 domain-containing protein n=1 Tax=Aquimarina agarilytica TaxID=1087449 RepID=UPI0009D97220